jgi:hypothetical protein
VVQERLKLALVLNAINPRFSAPGNTKAQRETSPCR